MLVKTSPGTLAGSIPVPSTNNLNHKAMTENKESRMRTIARMAVRCVKLALSLTFAGLMGLVVMITLVHLYEANPRMYAAIVGVMVIGSFVYLTVSYAKRDDNGREGFA